MKYKYKDILPPATFWCDCTPWWHSRYLEESRGDVSSMWDRELLCTYFSCIYYGLKSEVTVNVMNSMSLWITRFPGFLPGFDIFFICAFPMPVRRGKGKWSILVSKPGFHKSQLDTSQHHLCFCGNFILFSGYLLDNLIRHYTYQLMDRICGVHSLSGLVSILEL